MSTTSTNEPEAAISSAVPVLPGTVQAAPPGQKGFDTDAFKVTAADAATLVRR